jgi:hypothetical protein
MTYREKIQMMVKQIDEVYNDAEWLRDIATLEEKQYWNELRRIFYDAANPLKKLDRQLSASRAQTEI